MDKRLRIPIVVSIGIGAVSFVFLFMGFFYLIKTSYPSNWILIGLGALIGFMAYYFFKIEKDDILEQDKIIELKENEDVDGLFEKIDKKSHVVLAIESIRDLAKDESFVRMHKLFDNEEYEDFQLNILDALMKINTKKSEPIFRAKLETTDDIELIFELAMSIIKICGLDAFAIKKIEEISDQLDSDDQSRYDELKGYLELKSESQSISKRINELELSKHTADDSLIEELESIIKKLLDENKYLKEQAELNLLGERTKEDIDYQIDEAWKKFINASDDDLDKKAKLQQSHKDLVDMKNSEKQMKWTKQWGIITFVITAAVGLATFLIGKFV